MSFGKQFEEEVRNLVEEVVKEKTVSIEKQEVSEIVSQILPDVDKMVSNKVKKHLRALAELLLKNLKEE